MNVLILGGYTPAHRRLLQTENVKLYLFHYTKAIKSYYSEIYEMIFTFKDLNRLQWVRYGEQLNTDVKIDAIITFDDDLHKVALDLSSLLNIPYLYNENIVELMVDKHKMRTYLKKSGFSNISSIVLNSKEDLINSFLTLSTDDIIVKPIDGAGSKYIYKLNKFENIELFYNHLVALMDKLTFIIEPYLKGIEYSVEAYSEDGVHKVYCITKKYKDSHFVEMGHTIPAQLDNNTIDNITDFITKFLNIIKFENGPSHTEIIVSENKINLVESQARVGGDMINELYEASTGQDILTSIVKGMIGFKVINDIKSLKELKDYKYSTILYRPSINGTVTKIEVDESIRNTKGILGHRLWIKEGDKLSINHSSSGRIAQVWAVSSNSDESYKLAEKGLQYIRIETTHEI
ncbi:MULTISPECIES: ATP-grasp domain-containing protein [unclassified Granulicatella]|uniref:ATP-grasp domain-containing protein n=1 Tax=unclassified Granulicatella TaxID=2630493 RepID=UPI0010741277|nr:MULTISPECIES: ATP-grasp domain-containing protein [unclassified Granulicatella]MBF0780528.1 ATP-grasp domain-containing protein [Granulicatella sp. 19428wC4_WM01]TFU94933.1 ATP-grasp domain-containing protein [Granulicatella sp. WM01]